MVGTFVLDTVHYEARQDFLGAVQGRETLLHERKSYSKHEVVSLLTCWDLANISEEWTF